jgi:hypothetical protein
MSRLLRALLWDADQTTHTARAHSPVAAAIPAGPEKEAALQASAYTLGVEAGLALGLQEPAVASRLLAAIDTEVHGNDRRATVDERQQVLAHYRTAAQEA